MALAASQRRHPWLRKQDIRNAYMYTYPDDIFLHPVRTKNARKGLLTRLAEIRLS